MLRHCQVLISFLLCIIVCHVHSIRMESFLSGMNFVGDARRSMGMIIPKAVTDNKPKSKLDPTLEKFYISEVRMNYFVQTFCLLCHLPGNDCRKYQERKGIRRNNTRILSKYWRSNRIVAR